MKLRVSFLQVRWGNKLLAVAGHSKEPSDTVLGETNLAVCTCILHWLREIYCFSWYSACIWFRDKFMVSYGKAPVCETDIQLIYVTNSIYFSNVDYFIGSTRRSISYFSRIQSNHVWWRRRKAPPSQWLEYSWSWNYDLGRYWSNVSHFSQYLEEF